MSISLLTGDNGLLEIANKSAIYTEFAEINEQLSLYEMNIDSDDYLYMNTDETNLLISNSKYKDKFGVYRNEFYYLTSEVDSKTAKYAEDLDFKIINMSPDEFKYYIEMGVLQDKVSAKTTKHVGRELGTAEFNNRTITIGTNTYSNGWYIIGNYGDEQTTGEYNSNYKDLGLTDTTHAPYIVNYTNGVVLSIDGMEMNATQISVHSFDMDVRALSTAYVYIDSSATRTGDYFGNLYSRSLYTGPVYPMSAKYDDNDGELVYDEDGALLLDKDNSIPVLDINQKYQINNVYSVAITFNGDISQGSGDGFCNTLIAISGESGQYCSWIGIFKKYLHVYSFRNGGPMSNMDRVASSKGAASISIAEYEGQTINVQVTAVRNGKTNVYINGECISTFDSGGANLAYKYLTMGDLRVGRNLKFKGKIYDFMLFGTELTQEQVLMNYENSKKIIE